MRTQLHHVSGNIYLNEGGVNDDGEGKTTGHVSKISVRPSFPLLIHPLLSAVFFFAEVSGLYPVIVIAALCHPVCLVCPPQTVEHGFPHQPSALCFSPSLQLLAIGTRSGAIKLYP